MRFQFPNGISSDFDGYRNLIDLYNKIDALDFDDITLVLVGRTGLKQTLWLY